MVNIYNDLEEVTGLIAYQQGTVPKEMPESYVTVWNTSSLDNLNANNKTISVEYEFTVIYYTTDWKNIYTKTEEMISLLKAKGYVIDGRGFDIDSGMEDYVARCIEVSKIEKLED